MPIFLICPYDRIPDSGATEQAGFITKLGEYDAGRVTQVERLQGAFNLKSVILVGDRGMISQKQVDEEKVSTEAALDGIYVIRTSLADELSAADAVINHCFATCS